MAAMFLPSSGRNSFEALLKRTNASVAEAEALAAAGTKDATERSTDHQPRGTQEQTQPQQKPDTPCDEGRTQDTEPNA